ncbi:alpha/beta hydrolase [Rhodococcus sp. AW25M09]|uniref:alpha/beta hydrolase n=1 Tax=Rhodococcus sp. AW25M09 TaxID=1268303 RepID=UPI000348DEA5|nr:alpha/beta hydrolase [Rhodococcus sp. AW25M09]
MDLTAIDNWDIGALDATESSLTARVDALTTVQADLASLARLPGWDGEAAATARGAYGMTQDEVNREAVELGAIRTLTQQTIDAVTHLKAQLAGLRARASADLMLIASDGSVVDASFAVLPTDPVALAAREAVKRELHDGAHALIMQAFDVDSDGAQVFSSIAAGTLQADGATDLTSSLDAGSRLGELSAPYPPEGASPQQIDAYWDALPEAQRAEMIAEHPTVIGNLDGIPSVARSEANISRIPGDREHLQALEAQLRAELDSNTFGGWASNDDAGLTLVRNKLASLDAIDQALRDHPEALLTVYDVSDHERALAAVAIGNPDTADHVTVTTPGFDTTVHGSLTSMVSEAAVLNGEMRNQLDLEGNVDDTVANVAWIGYEPPQSSNRPGLLDAVDGIGDVLSDDRATEAGGTLSSYYRGLDAASTVADPHISAFGHSYGSLTTSEALQQGGSEVVDDAVFYGSPGLNAVAPSSMGMPYEHVWAIDADGDMVTTAGHFGPFALFEAGPYNNNFQQLSSEAGISAEGVLRDGSSGHSEYTRSGDNGMLRTSGYNLAVIGIGRPDLVMQ